MIIIGEYNDLTVIRKSDLGYMLSDGKNDVLMHFKQSKGEHKDGERLTVFIYTDKQNRPCAIEGEVAATLEEAGFVTVVDVLKGAGVFVNNNTPKDILISKDYLPYDEALWPVKGEKLLVRLKIKGDILSAKPLNRFEIISLHTKSNYGEREHVVGYVCRITEKGVGIVSDEYAHIFVPQTQLRGKYRLGQEVEVVITKAIDGEYYGMLNALKEEMIEPDRDAILSYMKLQGGKMPFTAKSSAEEIEATFKMSRKAFKRAYGSLYKDRIIDFKDDVTFIVK